MVVKPIDQLKKKVEELEAENNFLRESSDNQLVEIARLQECLDGLRKTENTLRKEKQKVKEQEKTIAKLETSLNETREELDKIQNESVRLYKEKLVKASNDMLVLNRTIRNQSKDSDKLREEVKQLTDKVATADAELNKKVLELEQLRTELENAKKAASKPNQNTETKHVNASFTEFVKTKRELSQMHSENRRLRQELHKKVPERPLTYLSIDST